MLSFLLPPPPFFFKAIVTIAINSFIPGAGGIAGKIFGEIFGIFKGKIKDFVANLVSGVIPHMGAVYSLSVSLILTSMNNIYIEEV